MALSFDEFVKSTMQNGVNSAIRRVKEKVNQSINVKYDETEINDLGYHFLNELNRIDDAIEIFKFNIILFPKSSNAYDSLGEAYFVKGVTEEAILNYRESLELNPTNKNAHHMLRQLRFMH